MTRDKHSITARIAPTGAVLAVKRAEIALDEAWSPYCSSTLVCSLPDGFDRDLIDMRDNDLYLDVQLRQDFGTAWPLSRLTARVGGSIASMTADLSGRPLATITNLFYRPWNGAAVRGSRRRSLRLIVTERTFDDLEKEIRIVATSFESLLIGDALIQSEPLDPGTTSLAEIAQLVLARYGLALAAGYSDATVAEAEATLWAPGVSAADYLSPLLEAASLRLWCGDKGVFRLSPRQETTPGAISLTPTGTITELSDTMSIDPEVWFDAVVIEYRWVDEFDLNQVAYDSAGAQPAKSTLFVQRSQTRYPGPGAAGGLLNRVQGRGRVLDVRAVSNYLASPGISATITPIDTDVQTGFLSSVVWFFPDAEMEVTSRGLVDTTDTAYLFGPAGVSYLDVPVGIDYTEFEWSDI